ncbi:MAG TPA: DegT/DnrJ/EryC1/StrS family aminotransferase [Pyrinomonadaceae bacterium]|nr:DegT/DnrJ/EryC1/StrS family aminotransferase [Pyrinomonadaceae bacterium]
MPLSIPQSNPLANYLSHRDEIDGAIKRVLETGWYILGQEVTAFETEFANYLGSRFAIGVGNGTDALYLALRACDVGQGDGVVTVSHTAGATVAAIEQCGATPLLVDIDAATFTMNVEKLADAIANYRGRIKAIVPVHMYGQPSRITDIVEIAAQHGLYVVEDCAQAHGALWQDRKVGTFGHLAAFSFYPTKNLGALGDGGAVVTNDAVLAERVRRLRQYGWEQRYISESAGVNSRLDELQAAILVVKLRHLDENNSLRINLARIYSTELADLDAFKLPETASGATHVYHQYVVRTTARDELRDYLRQQGTGTLVHYPVPVHLQPAYRQLSICMPLSETEAAAREILSLPLYPELTEEQVNVVVQQIKAWKKS